MAAPNSADHIVNFGMKDCFIEQTKKIDFFCFKDQNYNPSV